MVWENFSDLLVFRIFLAKFHYWGILLKIIVSTQFHPPPFCWRKDFPKKGAWDMSNFPVGDSNNLAKFCLGEG